MHFQSFEGSKFQKFLSKHFGQLKYIFSHLRALNLKNLSSHGRQFEFIFSRLIAVNFEIFFNHGE